jgi:hypothetical protein
MLIPTIMALSPIAGERAFYSSIQSRQRTIRAVARTQKSNIKLPFSLRA